MSDVVTIRIRSDQSQKIKEMQMNLSEFVRNKLDEEFETTETLDQEEKDLKKKIKEIKSKKEKIKNRVLDKKDTKKEEKYLKQMKEHSRMFGIEDALKNYNMKFGKKISMEKFLELIGE